jgi:hypothetical protein
MELSSGTLAESNEVEYEIERENLIERSYLC